MTTLARFMCETEPWDILVRDYFKHDSFFAPALNTQLKYPVDIYEDDTSLNIEIAVAGIDKKDITIEEEDNVLRVSYEKIDDDKNQNYLQKGIAKRAFNFGWKISDKFDLKNISAEMDKGILKISILKAEETKPVKNTIQIK